MTVTELQRLLSNLTDVLKQNEKGEGGWLL